jgi:hypothetical protein
MVVVSHSCVRFVYFGKFNDFFWGGIFLGMERKMESKLASNTERRFQRWITYQFVLYTERSRLPLEKILLRKVHLRGAEKVNKRSKSAQLYREIQGLELLKATALGCFFL